MVREWRENGVPLELMRVDCVLAVLSSFVVTRREDVACS
jgi:hypothetical protein